MSEEKKQASAVESELNKLGDNLNNLFRAIWDSDERKTMEREITAGLEQVNKSVNDAAEKMRTDKNAESIKKGVKDAWENARGPQILQELETGLSNTLSRLNEEIARRAKPAQEVKPDAHAADVVVDAEVTPVGEKKPD